MKKDEKALLAIAGIGILAWLLSRDKYKCPRCNHPVFKNNYQCPNCGQPLVWEENKQWRK